MSKNKKGKLERKKKKRRQVRERVTNEKKNRSFRSGVDRKRKLDRKRERTWQRGDETRRKGGGETLNGNHFQRDCKKKKEQDKRMCERERGRQRGKTSGERNC